MLKSSARERERGNPKEENSAGNSNTTQTAEWSTEFTGLLFYLVNQQQEGMSS